jgi:hypothetical protein
MATAAAIQQRVRDNLYSAVLNERPFAHLINGAVNNSVTTIAVDDGTNFAAGDIIEFLADGEQCYVQVVATNNLTVIRGWNGTTAASQSDNEVILKNPRFTYKQIDDAITATLHELATLGVYIWGTGDITLVANQYYYDITKTDIIEYPGIVGLYYAETITLQPVPLPFKYTRGLNTTVSATGHGLYVPIWGDKAATDKLYYTYSQAIDATTDLLSRQEELVVLGATARALGKAVAPRTHDPGRLTDKSVKAGQDAQDARWYQAEFYMRSRAEAAQLTAEVKHLPGTLATKVAGRWHP